MMASDHDSSGKSGHDLTVSSDVKPSKNAGVNNGKRTSDDHDDSGSDFSESESEVNVPMMQRSYPEVRTMTSAEKSTTLTTASAVGHESYLADTSWKTHKYYGGTLSNPDRLTSKPPSPTGMMAWVGFSCCMFALVCLSISFCSPYWLQTWPLSENRFRNIGLWHVCFHDYMHFKDDSQQVYSECWWLLDRHPKYYKLREWLTPPWFITCQILTTGCLILEITTVITLALIFLHFCPLLNHEYLQTYGVFASAAIMFLVTMISFVTAILFGVQINDRFWMPRPDQNFLSWGFGFLIISAIFALFSGICLFQEGWKAYNALLNKEDEHTKAAIQMTLRPPSNPLSPDYTDRTTATVTYPLLLAPGTSSGVVHQRETLPPPPRYSPDARQEDSLVKPALMSVTNSSQVPSSDDVADADSDRPSSTLWPPPPPQTLPGFKPPDTGHPTEFGAAPYGRGPMGGPYKFEMVSGPTGVHEQQPRFMQPTNFGGKSFAKSFDRQYSDDSFDDPGLETFIPKVERQY